MPTAYANVTKPLYATVGAGDALYTAVSDAISQVRTRANATGADVQSPVERVREQIANLPAEVQEQIAALRERLGLSETPKDLTELRARLASDELRKAADSAVKSAVELYRELATRGEATVVRLRDTDAGHRAEEVFGKVTEQAQSLVDLVAGGKPAAPTVPTPAPAEEIIVEAEPDPEPEPKPAPVKPVKATRARKTTKPAAE